MDRPSPRLLLLQVPKPDAKSLQKVVTKSGAEKNPSHSPRESAGQSSIDGLGRIRETMEALSKLLEFRADLQNDEAEVADDGGAFVRGMAVIASDCAAQLERHQKDAILGVFGYDEENVV
jgi:hypothetical protein